MIARRVARDQKLTTLRALARNFKTRTLRATAPHPPLIAAIRISARPNLQADQNDQRAAKQAAADKAPIKFRHSNPRAYLSRPAFREHDEFRNYHLLASNRRYLGGLAYDFDITRAGHFRPNRHDLLNCHKPGLVAYRRISTENDLDYRPGFALAAGTCPLLDNDLHEPSETIDLQVRFPYAFAVWDRGR